MRTAWAHNCFPVWAFSPQSDKFCQRRLHLPCTPPLCHWALQEVRHVFFVACFAYSLKCSKNTCCLAKCFHSAWMKSTTSDKSSRPSSPHWIELVISVARQIQACNSCVWQKPLDKGQYSVFGRHGGFIAAALTPTDEALALACYRVAKLLRPKYSTESLVWFLQSSRSTFENTAVCKLPVSSISKGAVPGAITIKPFPAKESTKIKHFDFHQQALFLWWWAGTKAWFYSFKLLHTVWACAVISLLVSHTAWR